MTAAQQAMSEIYRILRDAAARSRQAKENAGEGTGRV